MKGRVSLRGGMIWGAAMAVAWMAPALRAQTSEGEAADKSWSATSDSQYSSGVNNTRTSESHKVSGNKTVDKRSLQNVGPDGRYQNYQDVETETVKVNATTTRAITRTYDRDANGARVLVQVTEEESKELPNGGARRVKTTSNPDYNGRMQAVQSEVQETKKVNPDVVETSTTVSLPGSSGGLTPMSRSVERQTKTGENSSKFRKSTENRDLNGGWQLTETREGTTIERGDQKTTEETVSRADANGRLSVASRTVSKEVTGADGQARSTVETYSSDAPGAAPDTGLRLNRRTTTVQKKGAGGSKTETQVEDLNPGSPSEGLRVSSRSIDIVKAGPNGTSETRTTEALGGSGLDVVQVDTRKSDQVPAVKVEIAPATKPK